MSLPPPSKISSAQRIVSLQNLHYQVQLKSLSIAASKCRAIDTIAHKICFKHIEGHTVLHYVRTVARVVRFKYPAKPLVQREMCCSQEMSGNNRRRDTSPVLLAMPNALIERRPARAFCCSCSHQEPGATRVLSRRRKSFPENLSGLTYQC